MSDSNEVFREFIRDLMEPEKHIFNIVMNEISKEMTNNSAATVKWLRSFAALKKDYQTIAHQAIASDLRYMNIEAIRNHDEIAKSVMNRIAGEYGGLTVHHLYSVQSYASETVKNPLKSDNRFGYRLEVHHRVHKSNMNTVDDWNFNFDPNKSHLPSILDALRVRLTSMLYRKSVVSENTPINQVISSTIDAFCRFVFSSDQALEHVMYKRQLLKNNREPEQMDIMVTQGSNEVICGFSIH